MNTEILHKLQELGMLVLIIATVVAVVARRLRLPYTFGLVLIGGKILKTEKHRTLLPIFRLF